MFQDPLEKSMVAPSSTADPVGPAKDDRDGSLAPLGAALVVSLAMSDGNLGQYGLIVLLALAMGLQNAAARFLAVPDLTTTVLTLTLTRLAADSTWAGGNNPRIARRLSATGA